MRDIINMRQYLLTNNEIQVLNSFMNINEQTLNDILKNTSLNSDSALQAIYLLEEKNYIKIEKEIDLFYNFSSEGKEYLEKGLPERQLLQFINKEKSLEDIKCFFPESFLKIALSWFLKKKWGFLKNGILIAANKKQDLGIDELFIKNLQNLYFKNIENDLPFKIELENNSNINKLTLLLIKRKLITSHQKINMILKITTEGSQLLAENIKVADEINQISHEFLLSKKWNSNCIYKQYDLKKPLKKNYSSKLHPYQYIIDEMRQIFLEMGFKEINGEIIQSSFWNFDALFQPQDHPAREMQDTFYLDSKTENLPEKYIKNVKKVHENGWKTTSRGWGNKWEKEIAKQNVLRTHTTAITAQYLSLNPYGSFKTFCIARVYRRESIDSTHTSEFEQLEGIIKSEDKNMNFSHLLGFLKEFYLRMGFEKIRFRPGYFPYTEPSVEPEVYVDELGWVELGGAGMLRAEVLEPLGVTGNVLAWGLGVSRVAMLKMKLKDLRKLYQSDIKWIRDTSIF